MTILCRKHLLRLFSLGLLAFLMVQPALYPQTTADETLTKKYEKILGRYEFDLSSLGADIKIFNFYIQQGAFWADYGFTSPGEMKPVGDSSEEFTFVDPDDGPVKITFIINEDGQYTKCRCVCEGVGLDVVGNKIK